MNTDEMTRLVRLLALIMVMAAALAGCGGNQEPPAAAPPPAGATSSGAAQAPQPLERSSTTWTPEELEELMAPVALYPDPVLMQVLLASTNPQEVLDAGNWLVANPALEGKALDASAEQAGFTPPVRALAQFPQVVDQMCLNMSWTEEVGQAYVNDQAGVMDAVQRLRVQARDVGNLKTSEQLKVETEEKEGKEVVTISPPRDVVYVPQYDPQVVYVPAPAAAPAATTTVVEDKDEGHSTGTLITTGLLSFGAGILASEIFEDDDDDYYYPNWYGPMPYHPPYPYRPVYGGGFYPAHGYNRPNNYMRGSNNNIIINQNDNYFDRFDDKAGDRERRPADSPITRANRNRNDLMALNRDAAKGPKRGAPAVDETWKGRSTYAGATGTRRPTGRAAPKVQGSYVGARPSGGQATTRQVASTRPAAAPRVTTRAGADRGYGSGSTVRAEATDRAPPEQRSPARPSPARQSEPQRSSAFSGARAGGNERAASQRGRQSMSKGGGASRSKGGARRGR